MLLVAHAALLLAPTPPRRTVRVGPPSMKVAELPGSPKDLATQMSLAIQAALTDRHRRLEIVLPDGLCFGLFGEPPGKQMLGDPDATKNSPIRRRADREAAYLVLEMFQGLGEGACACVLPNGKEVSSAEREWAGSSIPPPRLVTSPGALVKRAAAGFGKGAAAPSAQASTPPKLIVVVRPTRSVIKSIAPVADPLGDEVVVCLINPVKKVAIEGTPGYLPAYTLLSNPCALRTHTARARTNTPSPLTRRRMKPPSAPSALRALQASRVERWAAAPRAPGRLGAGRRGEGGRAAHPRPLRAAAEHG